ncbi:hypothetical protein MPY17_37725 (plasmid) [Rhodococcus opacus]|nr:MULTISPECIES: hypothetical protein [Rhodococcus]UOT08398.1 hypothetical protein MPY17_37725 [Rhodococcus opacus]
MAATEGYKVFGAIDASGTYPTLPPGDRDGRMVKAPYSGVMTTDQLIIESNQRTQADATGSDSNDAHAERKLAATTATSR